MARADELVLLRGAVDEDVLARAALLDELALRAGDVEDRLAAPGSGRTPRCTTSRPGAA